MQIFVAGTSKDSKASAFRNSAYLLGRLIAEAGYDLGSGAGSGIAKYVVEGYRSVGSRGRVRFYLPLRSAMDRVEEEVGEGADEIIETELDYPMRNVFQVRASDALFILTGGDGTLEEAVTALADYSLPVAAVKGSGAGIDALEVLLPIFPRWAQYLILGTDVHELMAQLDRALRSNVNSTS